MSDIIHSPVVAKAAAVITGASGLEAIFIQFVHPILSVSATLVGIVLSIVLIMTHWKKRQVAELERQKLKLELERARDFR